MWNAALDRRENEVMQALLTLSSGKTRFLVSPEEVLSLMRVGCDAAALERVLFSLSQDGYLDYVATERKGEETYVIELRAKGTSFVRTVHNDRRRVALRFVLAVVCGVASALIGLLLKCIFS